MDLKTFQLTGSREHSAILGVDSRVHDVNEVAQRLVDRGIEPVFLPSHQFVGSQSVEEQLEVFYSQYARRIAPLYSRQG